MQAVPAEEFLRWMIGVGIDFDARYPDYLALVPPCEHARFWVLPPDPANWPRLMATLLSGLDEWSSGYLWPLSRSWPLSANSPWHAAEARDVVVHSLSRQEGVRDVVLRGVGIPDGWTGAIRFDRNEEDKVIAILFAFAVFASHLGDDLYFVPVHGRQLIQTDHHDVIHVDCRSVERIDNLVKHMAEAEYKLPTELPDATFIRPAWMIYDPETPLANGAAEPD
jgi:hypothetical protein